MRRLLSWLMTLAVVLAIAGAGAFYILKHRFEQPGPSAEPVTVLLPSGSGLGFISNKLAARGAISDATVFRLATRFEGAERSLRAGEYEFPAGASMREVLDMLRKGAVLQRKVTLAEGLTSLEIVEILRAHEALGGEISSVPAEGTLAPDTYLYQRGDDRAALLGRMAGAQAETLKTLWPDRAADLPFETKEEALVLASIVEKETALASERARVAAVFVNRLRRGMRLQSDPTVIYGITLGKEPFEGPIRRSHLKDDNPYNTYVIDGLPPGPIANPGRDAIAAVLNPAETDELYFVADGTGGHAFARTLKEHNRNVRKWREIERSQN